MDSTLTEQKHFNSEQLRLNEIVRERHEQRYAARVSWWMDGSPIEYASDDIRRHDVFVMLPHRLGTLRLQNRSPVLLRRVSLLIEGARDRSGSARPVLQLTAPDMPPCSIRTYDVMIPMSTMMGMRMVADELTVKTEDELAGGPDDVKPIWRLAFTDRVGSWQIAEPELRAADNSADGVDHVSVGSLEENTKERSTTEDCAESG